MIVSTTITASFYFAVMGSDAARVALRPTKASIGLLLTRMEFDEVVARHESKLNLHPIILEHIFDWTAGHVGAVVQLLHVLAHQVSLFLKGHWRLSLLYNYPH